MCSGLSISEDRLMVNCGKVERMWEILRWQRIHDDIQFFLVCGVKIKNPMGTVLHLG